MCAQTNNCMRLLSILVILINGCVGAMPLFTSNDGGPDARPDSGIDAARDTLLEQGPDVGADVPSDAAFDVQTDSPTIDVSPGPSDAAVDVFPEVGPDAAADSGVAVSPWTAWPFLAPGGQMPLCLGLSGDGQRMVIGQRVTNSDAAADRTFTVFRAATNSWEVEQRISVGAFVPEAFSQGSWIHSCDLNGDGSVLAMGFVMGRPDPSDGAAFVATRTGTAWTLRARLNADSTQQFGEHVSLSSSGTRITVSGSSRFFAFDSADGWNVWTRESILTLVPQTSGQVYGEPGYARLSPDGNTFVANGFVMRRTGGTWSQIRDFALDGYRSGSALSRDGSRILVGRQNGQTLDFQQYSAQTFMPVGNPVAVFDSMGDQQQLLWLGIPFADGTGAYRVHRYGQSRTWLYQSDVAGNVTPLRGQVSRDWRSITSSLDGNLVVATGDGGVYTFAR